MRQVKLTTSKEAPARQRKRTEQLIDKQADLDVLPDNPPKWLKSYARAMWTKIIPVLKANKVVKKPDSALVEAFCMNYEILRSSYENIREFGIQKAAYKTEITPQGEVLGTQFVGFKKNPAVQSIDQASVKLNSLGGQLGLSPQSRAELMKLDVDSDDESIDDVLNGGEADDF